MSVPHIRRALISVSDKTGCVELATQLCSLGVEILSTGGTARLLADSSIPVTEVSAYTGFPEMMDGRVKTLHPKIHGGLLGRRGVDDRVMIDHGILPIDLVVVNLYPFEDKIEDPTCSLEDAIENIDIGGPTLLRAAAKNYDAVTTLVDSADYGAVIAEIESEGGVSDSKRFALGVKAFVHTAHYDGVIANYLSSVTLPSCERQKFSSMLNLQFRKLDDLRYGENPHQQAAFYADPIPPPGSMATATLIQGKAMSYNNIADCDAALECVGTFDQTACVIVKHANPCGVAIATTALEAYESAFQTDPVSAFGGIIAFNCELDAATAEVIVQRQFVEVIAATSIGDAARLALATKKNLRVLVTGVPLTGTQSLNYKRVSGGLLVQDHDDRIITPRDLKTVTTRNPTQQELADMQFAWKVVKFVKSNAIVYARDQRVIGIGAGQMSRVYSAKIAGLKAEEEGLQVNGSVMASDAFFPFRDSIDAAHETGITAIIQPGGSVRDQEVIDAADEYSMAMVLTGMRHFRH